MSPGVRAAVLRQHARDLVGGESRFEFALDMLIDGIARHVGM